MAISTFCRDAKLKSPGTYTVARITEVDVVRSIAVVLCVTIGNFDLQKLLTSGTLDKGVTRL